MPMMVITCESCGTRFRLDSSKLARPRNKVRCSKCKNTFSVEQPDEDGLIHIEISDEESSFIPGTIPEYVVPPVPDSEGKKRSSIWKILFGGIAALLIIGALVFVFGPGSSLIFTVKTPPPVQAKPAVTITDSVQAYYLENMQSGQVLVIEGEVQNGSSTPVSFVMIEGNLFDGKDRVSQTQRCYAGNSFTRKEITNLKVSEIQERMMNREGRNLKDVRIPPAGKASFMLVFHNLPEISSLSNYSVNVVSSKSE